MSEAELAGGFADPPRPACLATSRAGSRTTTCAGFRRCPGQPGSSCCWRRPTRPGTPRCCGGPRTSWAWDRDAAAAADAEQLLDIGSQVRFRHPLVRSAAYAAGSPEDRRAAHLTLAAATDAQADPERRVWHLAAAATGPDEDVAAALEQAAAKIQARAGLAASAAFLQRSVDADRRAGTAHRTGPGGSPRVPARRRVRHRARPAGPEPKPDAVDDLQRARVEHAPGTDRVGIRHRTRGARSADAGGQETRITRCGARPGDLPSRLGGVPPRWSPRRTRRATAGGFPSGTSGPSAGGGSAAW